MCDPIIHIQFFDNVGDEIDKNVISFCLIKQFPLVNRLNIEISIDWNLNYNFH